MSMADKKSMQSSGLDKSVASETTKPIDTNQLANVKAAVTMRKEKKSELQKTAREEEKNYVEFRKLQILYDCRPTSAVALRKSDESFPRRRRGVNMGFGERKAYFLSVRPDPKYATWFGKKKKEKKEQKLHSPTKDAVKPAAVAAATPSTASRREELPSTTVEEEYVKKGNNARKPIKDNGQPFWKVDPDAEKSKDDIDDDNVIVDMELIEKICDQSMHLKDAPFVKKTRDAFDDIGELKADDELFDKTLNFSNTARSVMALMVADADKNNTIKELASQKNQLTWSPSKVVHSYAFNIDRSLWTNATQPLTRDSSVMKK